MVDISWSVWTLAATNNFDLPTSLSLLARLRDPADQIAWSMFVERYAPKIYDWCRRFGVQENDAADLTQEVLVKLVRAMRQDTYDPDRGSFRSWLKAITGNAVRDLLRSWNHKVQSSGGSHVMLHLANVQDPRALAELTNQIESQYEHELLAQAEQSVRQRVKESTWEVYRLTMVEQLSPAEIAKRLNMEVGNVYVARMRVLKQIRKEVLNLMGERTESRARPTDGEA